MPTEETYSTAVHILSVDEDIGHEAIVDLLAARTLWKESSVPPSVITHQVLLFANPAVPDLPGARGDDEATSTSYFGPMSDGFPSRACVDAILSHGEVEAA